MTRPRILDLYSKEGGAGYGYWLAGFEPVGVDKDPQPRYPFEFIQADALDVLADPEFVAQFAVIHASPPCQHYSQYARNIGSAGRHPDLLALTRARLQQTGLPWVIENVPGAPMRPDVILCGSMFGLPIVRHRWFEFSTPTLSLVQPCNHVETPIGVYGHGTPRWHREKLGRNITKQDWCDAMGIDWMTKDGLSQAIPPAYAEHIGLLLMAHLREPAA